MTPTTVTFTMPQVAPIMMHIMMKTPLMMVTQPEEAEQAEQNRGLLTHNPVALRPLMQKLEVIMTPSQKIIMMARAKVIMMARQIAITTVKHQAIMTEPQEATIMETPIAIMMATLEVIIMERTKVTTTAFLVSPLIKKLNSRGLIQ